MFVEIPPALDGAIELHAFLDAQRSENATERSEAEADMNSIGIDTCSSRTLRIYETALKIPLFMGSEEVRRRRVRAVMSNRPPYTKANLERFLGTLCGFEIDAQADEITLRVEMVSAAEREWLQSHMARILPPWKEINVCLRYNYHTLLARLTHASAHAMTHQALRNEVNL